MGIRSVDAPGLEGICEVIGRHLGGSSMVIQPFNYLPTTSQLPPKGEVYTDGSQILPKEKNKRGKILI